MARNNKVLQPEVRGPVDAERKTQDDPPDPPLRENVPLLSSEIPLERIQADNRLTQAGAPGLVAAAGFLREPEATAAQLREALRFIAAADLSILEPEAAAGVREAIALTLSHADARVRVEAARALQVHGPGAQRTVFLTAIGDSERRVRWAVVRRFSDYPAEMDRAQRAILLAYLEAGTRAQFEALDKDHNDSLSRSEFQGSEDELAALDHDEDGSVSADEWASPVSSEVRADVIALLLRLHTKLTPDEKPAGYNPWLPSSDQLDVVKLWQQWSEQLS
jgi:hypothetical protein